MAYFQDSYKRIHLFKKLKQQDFMAYHFCTWNIIRVFRNIGCNTKLIRLVFLKRISALYVKVLSSKLVYRVDRMFWPSEQL